MDHADWAKLEQVVVTAGGFFQGGCSILGVAIERSVDKIIDHQQDKADAGRETVEKLTKAVEALIDSLREA